jgi:hypothetical protein
MDVEIGTGITSGKQGSQTQYDPQKLLAELRQQYPNADERALARHLRDEVFDELSEGRDYLLPIMLYFVQNVLGAWVQEEEREQRRAERQAERQSKAAERRVLAEQTKADVEEHIQEEAQKEAAKLLLDLPMPNGKRLRDCTGDDCRHFGGWFLALATKVGPTNLVGDVLSEQEVFQTYKEAA